MTENHHRHRSHQRTNPVRQFFRTFGVDIFIVLGLALAVFLLFEQMNIRATLLGWLNDIVSAGVGVTSRLLDLLFGVESRLGLSELIAIPMLICMMILVIWRIRWRLRNNPELVATHCPHCGGELQRVHRHSIDRVISVFVPVRRYRCTNRECNWSGRRVYAGSSRGSTGMARR
jgi:hypothetical protein